MTRDTVDGGGRLAVRRGKGSAVRGRKNVREVWPVRAGPPKLPALQADGADLAGVVEPAQIAAALLRNGLTRRDLARAAGVSAEAVRGWLAGAVAAGRHEAVLQSMRQTALALPRAQIGRWFRSPHPRLGGRRPLDVIASDPAAVEGAAKAGGSR